MGFAFGCASLFYWAWVDAWLLRVLGVAVTVYAVWQYPHRHTVTLGASAGMGYALSYTAGAMIPVLGLSLSLLPFVALHWLGFGGVIWMLAGLSTTAKSRETGKLRDEDS